VPQRWREHLFEVGLMIVAAALPFLIFYFVQLD
jgi:hypothetical protein